MLMQYIQAKHNQIKLLNFINVLNILSMSGWVSLCGYLLIKPKYPSLWEVRVQYIHLA